jgi:hypothetical protein
VTAPEQYNRQQDIDRRIKRAVAAVVAQQQAMMQATGTDATALAGRVTALEGRATALETRATTDEAAISALAARATTDEAAIAAVAARATALEARFPISVRIAIGKTAIALAANASADIPVAWDAALPDANYSADAVPSVGLLGNGTCVIKAGSKTANGCTVTVTASGLLLALGAQFIAVAAR